MAAPDLVQVEIRMVPHLDVVVGLCPALADSDLVCVSSEWLVKTAGLHLLAVSLSRRVELSAVFEVLLWQHGNLL